LANVSSEWAEKVGVATSVRWPTGIGGKGNEGVAGNVKNIPYSIGYIEYAYAKLEKMPYALLKNKNGEFVDASLESFKKAVFVPSDINPDRFFYDLINTPKEGGYPIVGFVYVLVRKNYNKEDCSSVEEVKKFLKWTFSDEASELATKLEYVSLPEEVIKINLELVNKVKCEKQK
jgi:phosphate transport system substrate-binding protein